jgi:hypothetical protein
LGLGYLVRGNWTAVGHDRQPTKAGKNLPQYFEAFAGQIGLLKRQSGDVTARPRK